MRKMSMLAAMFVATALLVGCTTYAKNYKAAKHCNNAALYNSKGDVDSAISEFTKAIELKPNFVSAYVCRGSAYMERDVDMAIADFTHAISLSPQNAGFHFMRALAYASKDEVDPAVADFDKVADLAHEAGFQARYFKAAMLYYDARFAEAIQAYRVAMERTPNRFEYWLPRMAVSGVVGAPLIFGTLPWKARNPLREDAEKKIQAAEAMLRASSSLLDNRKVASGMSKLTVLEIVSRTEKVVADDNTIVISVSKSGNSADKVLSVFVFKDDSLISEKHEPLEEALRLPTCEISGLNDGLKAGMSKKVVLEMVRATDNVVYEDEERVVTVSEWQAVKDKRLKFFLFKDDKLVRCGFRLSMAGMPGGVSKKFF